MGTIEEIGNPKPKTDPVTHAPERNIHFYFAVRRLSIQLSGVFHIEKKNSRFEISAVFPLAGLRQFC